MLVLVALVSVVLVLSSGEDTVGPGAERRAELQLQEIERDAELVVELTELARSTHGSLVRVLEGMDGWPGRGTADEVATWRAITDGVLDSFANPPSGSTGHNVARGGLRSAVELLAAAVTVYELALHADGEQRARLEELAADLRLQAVRAWSVAATQLDAINIEAGQGHVHIYLPVDGSGVMAPDSFPEGSEAHDHEEGSE